MKDFIDVLTNKNSTSSYLALEALYKDQLGIHITLDDQDDPFYLVNAKQLSSRTYQSPMKIGLPDMVSILQEAFTKRLQPLDTKELLTLKETLETLDTPELEELKFESTLVNQYKQVLKNTLADYLTSHLAAARQSPEVKETLSHLNRLLQYKTADKQYKEIQSFYRKELGIRIKEVSVGDDMGSAPYVADRYKKINRHAIQVDRSAPSTMLGTVELEDILSQYYKPIIATMMLSELFNYTKQPKAIFEGIPAVAEHADYQVLRYLNPFYQAIKQQLLNVVQPLLEVKQPIHISTLAPIIAYIDQLPDTGESVDPYFEKLAHCTIATDIDAIKACDLSIYIDARNLLNQPSSFDFSSMITALDSAITTRLSIYLQDYKKDVSTHITDHNKSKKLASIDEMLTQVEKKDGSIEELLTAVQAIFLTNITIHNSEPLGRYLYRCICSFFKLNIEVKDYQGKLFDTLTTRKKLPPTSDLALKNGNESDGSSDDETPLLKRHKQSGSI